MDLAPFHPQIVHFVIALLYVGVGARVLSFLPLGRRFAFLNPAATTLVVLGAIATVPAAASGTAAHGPAERVPGAREAVVEHEEWGERTRNAFLIIAALELGALGLAVRQPKAGRALRAVAGVAGVVGLWVVFEAGEHGGQLVYNYAGGIGVRSGDTADVRRLLVAGLYHNAQLERNAHNGEAAYHWFEELARVSPGPATTLMRIESLIRDRNDGAGALAELRAMNPGESEGMIVRQGLLVADAWTAMNETDSARAVVDDLARRYPENRRIQARLNPGSGPPRR